MKIFDTCLPEDKEYAAMVLFSVRLPALDDPRHVKYAHCSGSEECCLGILLWLFQHCQASLLDEQVLAS